MAKKFKTVRELNLEVELLSERIRKLEEKDVTINLDEDTKNKIGELERLLKANDENIKKNDILLVQAQSKLGESIKAKSDSYKCKECGKEVENKNILVKHIKKGHPKMLHCANCDETFQESWRLELHMKSHGNLSPFKCDLCERKFYSHWRMKKHKASHNELKKCCHYFNNAKICPYEEVGCKFKHEDSENCKFDKKCNFKLCQFKHTHKEDASEEQFGNIRNRK